MEKGFEAALNSTLVLQNWFLYYVLANIISLPIAYWLINVWLEHFAYCIEVTIIPFVLVIGVTVALVLTSAGRSSWKAGRMNPVDMIKGD